MTNHYGEFLGYASEEHKRRLVDAIDSSQKGNESRFGEDLSKYPVSLERVDLNADLIGEGVFVVKKGVDAA